MKTSVFLKTVSKTVGLLAILLALGLVLSCSDDSGDGGGGSSIPSELVGSWGVKGTSGASNTEYLKINEDGTGTYGNVAQDCTWSASEDTLTLSLSGQTGSVKWKVDNNKLTLSESSGTLAPVFTTIIQLGALDQL